MQGKKVNYKRIDTEGGVNPSFSIANTTGASYASHTGTPSKRGCWRIHISGSGAAFKAYVLETESGNGSLLVDVLASHSYQFIPGVTVTLGATLTDGDIIDANYSQFVADIV